MPAYTRDLSSSDSSNAVCSSYENFSNKTWPFPQRRPRYDAGARVLGETSGFVTFPSTTRFNIRRDSYTIHGCLHVSRACLCRAHGGLSVITTGGNVPPSPYIAIQYRCAYDTLRLIGPIYKGETFVRRTSNALYDVRVTVFFFFCLFHAIIRFCPSIFMSSTIIFRFYISDISAKQISIFCRHDSGFFFRNDYCPVILYDSNC